MKKNHLALAFALVATAFADTLDKGGNPYFLHCYRVAQRFIGVDDELAIAALMHDMVEDHKITIEELITHGFSQRIIRVVRSLTHDRVNETYDAYIKRVALDADATLVKLEDLKDNSDITRLKGLSKKDFDNMEKYHRSYIYLKN